MLHFQDPDELAVQLPADVVDDPEYALNVILDGLVENLFELSLHAPVTAIDLVSVESEKVIFTVPVLTLYTVLGYIEK